MLTRCARASRCMSTTSVAASERLYLGLDSSTQGLKATAIDADLKVHASFAINYQKDLPHYALKNGVHAKAGNVVTQPTLMVRRPPRAASSRASSTPRPRARCRALRAHPQHRDRDPRPPPDSTSRRSTSSFRR
jgi:hypothetical protein